ncbi:MoxR family ATPase [Saccharomonospora sp. CUA-673]|uniref:AAA family ATPase n=1 Tax=Saccharomonospora sp. CUA-673 TaxID=1904969 RepID=UPI0021013898|nr:MoxR family ATPase [Saccharomonospora sp. CUA-673]
MDEVTSLLSDVGYLADRPLATTVYLQDQLGKPLLLEGPAGVGKTELAKSLAAATGRRLLRLQCYEGQDETKALYEWDYGKQMLYTQILREKIGQVVADAEDLPSAVEAIGRHDNVFFSERFLAERPLLRAVRSLDPVVLLIDEVDRADEALEAVLLELLAEYQVSVPSSGRSLRSTCLRGADLQQYARPVGGIETTLSSPVTGLPVGQTGAGHHPVEEHRSARGGRDPSGGRGAGAATAGDAQTARHLRGAGLGTDARGARRVRTGHRTADGHNLGGGQVRP